MRPNEALTETAAGGGAPQPLSEAIGPSAVRLGATPPSPTPPGAAAPEPERRDAGAAAAAVRHTEPETLRIALGQCSARGAKPENHDFHGAIVPSGRMLALKGAAIAIADGISSSDVAREAAESAVKAFLGDYYCTPDAWSVRTAGHSVIAAANTWLHAQTLRGHRGHDMNRGFVCTFSALIVKGRTAHLFHVGDSRISCVRGDECEPLTNEHRLVISPAESYLSRALGLAAGVEVEYRGIDLSAGDVFVLCTDGVHEHVPPLDIARCVRGAPDLDAAAERIVAAASANGSPDNLTIQILRIDALPERGAQEYLGLGDTLPPAPLPRIPSELDGYRVARRLHASSRSHIYLATDMATGRPVALKMPSLDLRDDPRYLRRLAMEEWIARRIRSPHVLRAAPARADRRSLYVVTEYLEGQTLRQWMLDNPARSLETVRRIVEQIAKGLRAFHRMEMLHQDLRPENVMIDADGTVRIIDFGSVRVAGVAEGAPDFVADDILGTVQYAAPEYFLGQRGTERSDLFSLGVIAYELITGRLPYGARVSRARTARAQARLRYLPAAGPARAVPGWVDAALRRAVHVDPRKRYAALTELTTDLREPNPAYTRAFVPLAERDPVRFWQLVSLGLGLLAVLALLMR